MCLEPDRTDPPADPFGERQRPVLREGVDLLGGHFLFETNSAAALGIARQAYEGLPAHTLSDPPTHFQVRLHLTPSCVEMIQAESAVEPPWVRPLAGSEALYGVMDESSFAAIDPARRSALLVIPESRLRFPYHIRYELVEFAIYTLAARAQGLMPLHAACVGRRGRGVVLIGASGAGKSTLTLHCVLQGLEILAEDSVLVEPTSLLATGLANFLHLRRNSLQFLAGSAEADRISCSPVIRRRSGVEKLEIDLRRFRYALASTPLRPVALVFLSTEPGGEGPLLVPVNRETLAATLTGTQRYAAAQPGWSCFRRRMTELPAFELRRGPHPRDGAAALCELLERV